jgi:hypothetical protein
VPRTDVLQQRTGASSLTAHSTSRRLTGSTGVPAQCWLRTYPLNLPWVMPAKGVIDVQDCRRPAVPVARGERNRAVFSPASAVDLVARICGR